MMQIGGTDHVFALRPTCEDRALAGAAAMLAAQWPKAVFQDAETGKTYTRFEDVPFSNIFELFVFERQAFLESIDRYGVTHGNSGGFVHLLVRPNQLTVVTHP